MAVIGLTAKLALAEPEASIQFTIAYMPDQWVCSTLTRYVFDNVSDVILSIYFVNSYPPNRKMKTKMVAKIKKYVPTLNGHTVFIPL